MTETSEEITQVEAPPPTTLRKLKRGEVDLGSGVTLKPIFEGERLVAVNLTHPVGEDGGTCSKALPIGWGWGKHRITSKAKEPLKLSPSVWCPQHGFHGWIEEGVWLSMREQLMRSTLRRLRIKAAQHLKDLGADHEGAVLAIADLFYDIEKLEAENRDLKRDLMAAEAGNPHWKKKKDDRKNDYDYWGDFVSTWNSDPKS